MPVCGSACRFELLNEVVAKTCTLHTEKHRTCVHLLKITAPDYDGSAFGWLVITFFSVYDANERELRVDML